MAVIGQELKRERELRGISLQEISDATKINIRHLRDLEEDHLDNLPGKFFIKGIIRSYAKYIGLDEFAVLNSFYETELHKKQEGETAGEDQEEDFSLPAKFKKILLSVTLFLVLMAILTAIYLFIYKKPPVQEQSPVTPPIVTPAVTPAVTLVEEPPASPEVLTEETVQEIVLDLSFRLETWIQVYADGLLVIDGIKMPGETAQVTAKNELLIHTGNAGSVIYSLNGQKGIAFGRDGAVVKEVKITLDNMLEFIEKEDEELAP